jgi:hypothetical protein
MGGKLVILAKMGGKLVNCRYTYRFVISRIVFANSICWLHGGLVSMVHLRLFFLSGVLRYVFCITGCARDPMTHYSDSIRIVGKIAD